MSKMQEAWLAECRKFNLDPAYNKTWKEKFEAGYQAAIADVKSGGPFLIVAYDEESGVCEIRDVANPHNKDLNFVDLYKLEDV